MFAEIPQNLIIIAAGAFFVGWILSSISSRLTARFRASRRDARDDRIRSLEAELRVARTDSGKTKENLGELEDELKETHVGIERRDNVISHQQEKLDGLSTDLKDSVIKTRELRAELSDRATENVKSEAKLREAKTELEVAQASTDLLATGVLDYSMVPEADDIDDLELVDEDEMSKTAT